MIIIDPARLLLELEAPINLFDMPKDNHRKQYRHKIIMYAYLFSLPLSCIAPTQCNTQEAKQLEQWRLSHKLKNQSIIMPLIFEVLNKQVFHKK